MQVILQKDVKNVGKVGELVRVAQGFARNFLFPRKLAVEATEKRIHELEHLKKIGESKKKKATVERKEVLSKINGITLVFKVQAGEGDKLYGSITPTDISNELEKVGHMIDRKDILLEEAIKVLGQHKATIKVGESEATLTLSVERN